MFGTAWGHHAGGTPAGAAAAVRVPLVPVAVTRPER